MSLSALPATDVITQKGDRWSALWLTWVNGVQQWLGPQGGFGATASRPTKGLYVGLAFYDTTLGYPIFVHQVSPSVVWHNGAGATV